MKRVVVIPDKTKQEACRISFEVRDWLQKHWVQWIFDGPGSFDSDFAILLGGDGFITRKSLELGKVGIPIVAINFGQKGFLAVAQQNNWQKVLEKVLEDKYTLDKRPILNVSHFDAAGRIEQFEAAGNAYIRHKAYMILFTVSIDDRVLYKELGADGVVVANATGATAYNLAAKGPLISGGLVITPICPHRLDVAPLPVPNSAKKIEIIYHGRNGGHEDDEGCLWFLDSEKHPIFPGEKLVIAESNKQVSFIIPEGFSFIESLHEKLGLSR